MRKLFAVLVVLLVASLLAACQPQGLTEAQVSEIAAQAAKDAVSGIQFPEQQIVVEVVMPTEAPQAEESEPVEEPVVNEPEVAPAVVVSNSLVNPELFDADTQPVGDGEGYFDIGINPGQLGIVFGWDLSWGENLIEGEGCEIVVLSNGWYEDFRIVDGRYEIYTVPSTDVDGWTQVLINQRIAEQAEHYGCSADVIPPVWEGGK